MTKAAPCLAPPWTADAIREVLETPLLDLVFRAQTVHRAHHAPSVQLAALLSIKTGGCSEDCAYCAQSSHHGKEVDLTRQPLLSVDDVLAKAQRAKDAGASRFCMGAAGREVRDGPAFNAILAMVRGVRALGLEACVTLGMLKKHHAERLAEAGLTAYNHNLDTGPAFYGQVISTRTYQDRLTTLRHVSEAGIAICCGGIIGMGEATQDRAEMLAVLAGLSPPPESVPINALVAVKGTPLEDRPPVDPFDVVRMCAAARITMPKARVRLSAGRAVMSREAQALCFLAGANSIFYGEQLLTTPNNDTEADKVLLATLGLTPEHVSCAERIAPPRRAF